MKCPKCGNPRARYVEDRKKYQSKHKGFNAPEPRENFNAQCSKCGHKWNTED